MPSARHTVPDDARGQRIDTVVAALLGEARARAQSRLDQGAVTVDGAVVRKSHRVRGGEQVVVAAAAPRPPEPPPPVPVRYEDADVAVIAKPAGLVVHPGAGVRDGTVVDALRTMRMPLAASDDPARPGIVHRLDRGTSGLLAIAKTPVALTALRSQFDEHTIGRRYWALVDGTPDHPRATIEAPIARHPRDRTRFQTAPAGRRAVTHYVIERTWGRVASLQVTLETGRTHQVRVHLAAVGHPVCGDTNYGASAAIREHLGLRRPALHAAHLAFTHPVSGARVVLDEDLPEDLRAVVRRLDDETAR